jgi:nickel transport protein
MKGKPCRNGLWSFIFYALLFALVPGAWAHDFWVEQSGKELLLIFGHGDQREEFDISRVTAIKAFSSGGGEIEVRREKKGKGLLLQPLEPPSWVWVGIDNGYWSKTIYGWKNLPKRKASRVVEANLSICYAKCLLTWNDAPLRPAGDALLDIILLGNPWGMTAGDLLPFKVFFRGKATPGIPVEGRDHERVATTDKDGNGRVRMNKGRQLLSVSYKEPAKDDPDADFITYAATLTFEVRK